jgi:hypothetical protein
MHAQAQAAQQGAPGQCATLDEVKTCAEAIAEKGARTLNDEQRLAVGSVLAGAGAGVPFALFGPPGTGKTVTLVECALQARGPALHRLIWTCLSPLASGCPVLHGDRRDPSQRSILPQFGF